MKNWVWIAAVVALIWTVTAAVIAPLIGCLAANAGDLTSWTGQIRQWPARKQLAIWTRPEFLDWLRSAATSVIA